jgi:hypothetical protein
MKALRIPKAFGGSNPFWENRENSDYILGFECLKVYI